MNLSEGEAGRAQRLVAEGYDRIGASYHALGERTGWAARPAYVSLLLDALAPRARVLDLGCGSGVPLASSLAAAGHAVVAVDVSRVQLELTAANVPSASLVAADIADVSFAPHSFDAVACFYSLTHVPRDRHLGVLQAVRSWLRPGGKAVLTMGAGDHPDRVARDFLGFGAPMFISHFDAETNRQLVEQAGLRVEQAEVREQVEDGRRVRFCWVVGERPP